MLKIKTVTVVGDNGTMGANIVDMKKHVFMVGKEHNIKWEIT